MSASSAPNDQQAAKKPLTITVEEFDAKFEAGEDISDYIDWESGVSVEPGEISPGQKLAMEKEAAQEAQGGVAFHGKSSETRLSLSISLPPWAFDELRNEATRQGIGQEELAQLLILQRLDKQKAFA